MRSSINDINLYNLMRNFSLKKITLTAFLTAGGYFELQNSSFIPTDHTKPFVPKAPFSTR